MCSISLPVHSTEQLMEQLLEHIRFLKNEIKDKNEFIKSLLKRLSKHEDAVLSNSNKKPSRKIEEIQQNFNSHFGNSSDTLIKKNSVMEEIAHDIEKNTENFHDITLEHDKGSPKDHLRPAILGSDTSHTKSNIKRVVIPRHSMTKHVNGWEHSLAWQFTSKTNLNRVFIFQKKFLHIIPFTFPLDHCNSLYRDPKLFKLPDILKSGVINFFYQSSKNELSKSVCSKFNLVHEVHTRDTRNKSLIYIPRMSTNVTIS